MIIEQLKAIDDQGEAQGWGRGPHGNPQIFALWLDADTQECVSAFPEPLNDKLVELLCGSFSHDLANAIRHLAEAREKTQSLLRAAGIPDHEHGLLGIGLRAIALRTPQVLLDGEPQSIIDIINAVVGSTFEPIEGRFTSFYHRDGSQVQVEHDKGKEPTVDHTVEIGGGVEEALLALLNTLVPEEVNPSGL